MLTHFYPGFVLSFLSRSERLVVDGVYFNPMHNVIVPPSTTTTKAPEISAPSSTSSRISLTSQQPPTLNPLYPGTSENNEVVPPTSTPTIFSPIFDINQPETTQNSNLFEQQQQDLLSSETTARTTPTNKRLTTPESIASSFYITETPPPPTFDLSSEDSDSVGSVEPVILEEENLFTTTPPKIFGPLISEAETTQQPLNIKISVQDLTRQVLRHQ